MRGTVLAAFAALVFAQASVALPVWQMSSFTTTPENAPKIVAATDKLMATPIGKEFKGRTLLQVHVADGSNPATHSYAVLYKTAAEREAFGLKMQQDPAWNEFVATMARLSQPVASVRYMTLKSWGEVVDSDVVWESYAFGVEDPAAFLAALDKFMMSETGKKFPGQVHLSGVTAGGLTQVTHVISVGFASDAESHTWGESLMGNADWQAYLDASGASAEFLGGSLVRTVKGWGPASLSDLAVP